MLSYQYTYLLANIFIFILFWLPLFFFRKDLRHKMLLLSILIGFFGPLSELWYLQDYWKPLTITNTSIGIEDYFFGFLIGGIGTVFYEEIFGKRFSNRHKRKHNWALIFVFISGLSFLIFNLLFFFLKINSIYASVITFIILALTMILFRKDLWLDAVMSGVLCSFILLICYLLLLTIYPEMFIKMWHLKNLSGLFINKIPIEEILWAFGWGMIAGPMYEFYAGIKFKK
ncbi:hypothetical protein C4559_05575 [Candidatus Microgenomates bacterium]|nr:MAG: hypothetical protein C4559_05575 [Candidatus Microgenomates bacterium]